MARIAQRSGKKKRRTPVTSEQNNKTPLCFFQDEGHSLPSKIAQSLTLPLNGLDSYMAQSRFRGRLSPQMAQRLQEQVVLDILTDNTLIDLSFVSPSHSKKYGTLDLDAIVKQGPPWKPIQTKHLPTNRPIFLILDESLSMEPEARYQSIKAAFLLYRNWKPVGIIGYSTRARLIKPIFTHVEPEQLIYSLLNSPTPEYTNISCALLLADQLSAGCHIVIIGDGCNTMGLNPSTLTLQFRSIDVLQLGSDHRLKSFSALYSGRHLHTTPNKICVELARIMYSQPLTVQRKV